MGLVLTIIGFALIAIGSLWFLGVAFQKSIVWGILCILFPFASLYVLVTEWARARAPFGVHALGLIVFVAGILVTARDPSHRINRDRRMAAASSASTSEGAPLPPPPPEPPPEDDRKWAVDSFDGAVHVTQTPVGSDRCLVEARRGDQLLWSSSGCVGKKVDYKFVSASGNRLAVIYPLPTIEGSVGSTPVMRMFKGGKQQYASVAGATVANWERLRTGGANFYWLAGALDAPGEAPHFTDKGASFDFATVDGKTYHIPLD